LNKNDTWSVQWCEGVDQVSIQSMFSARSGCFWSLLGWELPYSYASTSRMVNRAALRAGSTLAIAESKTTTPHHTKTP
jgi:hypothetical protein